MVKVTAVGNSAEGDDDSGESYSSVADGDGSVGSKSNSGAGWGAWCASGTSGYNLGAAEWSALGTS